MTLPDFAVGTLVRLNGGGLQLQRKLSTSGIAFGDGHLTREGAAGTFVWLRVCDDREDITAVRDAIVRSNVSRRKGGLARDLFRRAR
jgi:hypothetical protein